MNIKEYPPKVVSLEGVRRFCSGKPPIRFIGWFTNHYYLHRNHKIEGDNISFTLEEDPGEQIVMIDGIRHQLDLPPPHFGCAVHDRKYTTIATTRRNELIFQYYPKDMTLREYPFSTAHFDMTAGFMETVQEILERMNHIHEPGNADHLDFLAMRLLTEAFVSASSNKDPVGTDPRIYQIANRITSRFEEDINIGLLAQEYGFSHVSFYREWNQYSKISPHELLMTCRFKFAKYLLSSTGMTIKEIAFRCGFSDGVLFSHSFFRRFGISPNAYRHGKTDCSGHSKTSC